MRTANVIQTALSYDLVQFEKSLLFLKITPKMGKYILINIFVSVVCATQQTFLRLQRSAGLQTVLDVSCKNQKYDLARYVIRLVRYQYFPSCLITHLLRMSPKKQTVLLRSYLLYIKDIAYLMD
jgi:hypothetical protein